jgi:hypothetical protein
MNHRSQFSASIIHAPSSRMTDLISDVVFSEFSKLAEAEFQTTAVERDSLSMETQPEY